MTKMELIKMLENMDDDAELVFIEPGWNRDGRYIDVKHYCITKVVEIKTNK